MRPPEGDAVDHAGVLADDLEDPAVEPRLGLGHLRREPVAIRVGPAPLAGGDVRAAPELAVSGSEVEMSRLDVERSRAHLMQGDPVRAEEFARGALERLGDQPRLESSAAQLALGDALHARGDVQAASRAYRWAADMLGISLKTLYNRLAAYKANEPAGEDDDGPTKPAAGDEHRRAA